MNLDDQVEVRGFRRLVVEEFENEEGELVLKRSPFMFEGSIECLNCWFVDGFECW